MEAHCREALYKRRLLLRFAAGFLFVTLFATGLAFSIEYFNSPTSRPTALSASVAQALAAQSTFGPVTLLAQSAIVVDLSTGVVLYERNADAQLPLASLAKVPLVLVTSEVLPREAIVTIARDTRFNSKASQLLAGERWYAKDLAAYTLVSSSNDGADFLAEIADEALRTKYSRSEPGAAIWRMNDLVQTLGLHSIYFLNATGLDVSETQSGAYGSARDVVALFAYANSHVPFLFAETATSSISITSLDGRVAVARNTDEALDSFPGLLMGKTGLTDLAGGNLAILFETDGRRYAAVVLGSTEEGRFSDMRQLTSATRAAIAAAK